MKTQTLLIALSLGISSLAMAGDFHGQFDSLGTRTSAPGGQAEMQTAIQPAAAVSNQQDIFQQNNNWHVQHNAR